ncbi:MAG: arsenite methyltransferase [Verrucomicrobia bacterium]|nr:arsenite methyltransferase [Verrucomicrobiota bacterium]
MTTSIDPDSLREIIRARYGALAEQPDRMQVQISTCCSPAPSSPGCCDGGQSAVVRYGVALGYAATELAAVPAEANLGLSCGNPLAIASIQPGEWVLDLGSGAGFDCFLAARQLGNTGRVIGVDMTPAMIVKARRNAVRGGYDNVEFRLGEIEALPVADATADLAISNCVINLSPEKPRVFREIFRVLKPGGRLAIADVVARQPLPAEMRADENQLAGCVAGAETAANLERWLRETGFTAITITPREESRALIDTWAEGRRLGDLIVSALIEARKPAPSP